MATVLIGVLKMLNHVPDFIPTRHEEGLEMGPNQLVGM
jgi:hypothetical protein